MDNLHNEIGSFFSKLTNEDVYSERKHQIQALDFLGKEFENSMLRDGEEQLYCEDDRILQNCFGLVWDSDDNGWL